VKEWEQVLSEHASVGFALVSEDNSVNKSALWVRRTLSLKLDCGLKSRGVNENLGKAHDSPHRDEEPK
jgi:hypothetical protein